MHGPRQTWIGWIGLGGWLLASGVGVWALQASSQWTFETDPAGQVPEGVTLASLRQPSSGAWAVTRTKTSGWFRHTADPEARGWAMAVLPAASQRDVELSVRLRASEGSHTGGLVWRYRDALNFYAVLLDLDDQKVGVYRVTNGNRVRLDVRDGLELDTNGWHSLKVIHDGPRLTVSIAGIRVLQELDGADPTVTGKVGVLSEGRAGVAFDDVRLAEPRSRR